MPDASDVTNSMEHSTMRHESPSRDASPSLSPSTPCQSTPSPSLSPFPAFLTCPTLDLSVSTTESSSVSSRSVSSSSHLSENGTKRRNGFMRPQGTAFAESAKHRDSVLSLGSIQHMQYYFARTGLLDGKGAQMAHSLKKPKTVPGDDEEAATTIEDSAQPANHPVMPPPTMSTYRGREPSTEPLPNIYELRSQMIQALDYAQKTVEDSDKGSALKRAQEARAEHEPATTDEQGFYEVQGMTVLDVMTAAIRSCKIYYTTHARPQSLYDIKPEKEIRAELYQVLDVLKRMASREFRGGIKDEEKSALLDWMRGVRALIEQEKERELAERKTRDSWSWRDGNWQGREREREWLFLNSFNTAEDEALPEWEPLSEEPSEFLLSLRSGLRLCRLHNEMVRRSERRFGEITTFYTDLAKPYRCADNIRYWLKAAELRWEIKLTVNVMDVVQGNELNSWKDFDHAIFRWCQGVREELSKEWREADNVSARALSSASGGGLLGV